MIHGGEILFCVDLFLTHLGATTPGSVAALFTQMNPRIKIHIFFGGPNVAVETLLLNFVSLVSGNK